MMKQNMLFGSYSDGLLAIITGDDVLYSQGQDI